MALLVGGAHFGVFTLVGDHVVVHRRHLLGVVLLPRLVTEHDLRDALRRGDGPGRESGCGETDDVGQDGHGAFEPVDGDAFVMAVDRCE